MRIVSREKTSTSEAMAATDLENKREEIMIGLLIPIRRDSEQKGILLLSMGFRKMSLIF